MKPLCTGNGHCVNRTTSPILTTVACAILFAGCATTRNGLEVSPESYRYTVLSAYQSAASKLGHVGFGSKMGDDPDIAVKVREDGVLKSDGHTKVLLSDGKTWAGGAAGINSFMVVKDIKEASTWGRMEHEWAHMILRGYGKTSEEWSRPIMKKAGIYGSY